MQPALAALVIGAAVASVGTIGNLWLETRHLSGSSIEAVRITSDVGILVVCVGAFAAGLRGRAWSPVVAALALLVVGFLQTITFAQPFYHVAAVPFILAVRWMPTYGGFSRGLVRLAGSSAAALALALATGWISGAKYCESCYWLPWWPGRIMLNLVPLLVLVAVAFWPRRRQAIVT